MTILVTEGACFIGSNFILDWLQRSEPIVDLDKLTYAGHLSGIREMVQWYLHNQSGIANVQSAPEYDDCGAWNDPASGIQWPIEAVPQLSAKDKIEQPLVEAELFA
jgi:dTDP-D-glucose 4,6-dehydratase